MWLKISLLVFLWCEVQGYGYRYNYNLGSGESSLWTFLPGHQQPIVYQYTPGVEWPQVYNVNYDGLLPGQPALPSFAQPATQQAYNEDPSLYRFKGPDGKFRYKCKTEAYWSEYLKKCQWKPGYYNKNRGGS